MSRDIESMCKRERHNDIAKRANVSYEMAKHINKHEYESYVSSLKDGEKVVIPGFCTIEPVVKERIGNDGQRQKYVTVKIHPSGVLEDKLNEVENFKIKKTKKENVEVPTLNELA